MMPDCGGYPAISAANARFLQKGCRSALCHAATLCLLGLILSFASAGASAEEIVELAFNLANADVDWAENRFALPAPQSMGGLSIYRLPVSYLGQIGDAR